MPNYVLLLHEAPNQGDDDLSPDEIQELIQRYVAWSQEIRERGHHVGGEKLADEGGRVLSMSGDSPRVIDGPYAEAKEIVGGYFVIQARDYDEAIEVAKGCPHLRKGNRIEVRQIDHVPGSD
jgi:hypothetical protein